MHLLEVSDFATGRIANKNFIYASILDIDGASGAIPHHQLARALKQAEADDYILRYVVIWLINRHFRARLRTATGLFHSCYRPITRGVPQGGVLSPLLWLIMVNDI